MRIIILILLSLFFHAAVAWEVEVCAREEVNSKEIGATLKKEIDPDGVVWYEFNVPSTVRGARFLEASIYYGGSFDEPELFAQLSHEELDASRVNVEFATTEQHRDAVVTFTYSSESKKNCGYVVPIKIKLSIKFEPQQSD